MAKRKPKTRPLRRGTTLEFGDGELLVAGELLGAAPVVRTCSAPQSIDLAMKVFDRLSLKDFRDAAENAAYHAACELINAHLSEARPAN